MESWQRTVRVLWMVQFLTTLAMNLGLAFVPFFLVEDPALRVRDESARVLYTGLIFAGPFFTTILFTPLWGWVADRTGPKKQVVRAGIGLGATQLLMAVAQSPEQLIAIRMVQGMVSGVLAACLGLLAVVTPPERHGRAVASLQSATPAGHIFGPLSGALLASAVGFRATYAILGSLILVAASLSWFLLRQNGFVPASGQNPFKSLYLAGRRALAQPLLRQALGILMIGQFAFTVAQGVFAIYAGMVIDAWMAASGVAPAWWNTGVGFTSIAMALSGLTSLLAAPHWGRLHDRRTAFLTPMGAGLLAASMLVLFAWPTWWAVLLARLGVGAGSVALATTQFAVIFTHVEARERSQLVGLATALAQVGNLIGFLLGGLLATWWTEAGNFALAAAAYAFIMFAALRLEWRTRTPAEGQPTRNHVATDERSSPDTVTSASDPVFSPPKGPL